MVLSSNDGCVISRSTEAKILGIKMGEPYFKVKKIVKENDVKNFSTLRFMTDMSEELSETFKTIFSKI